MTFDEHLGLILRWEGTYDNDPDDRGGETCFGITRKYQPDWEGWKTVAWLKENNVLKSQWPLNKDLTAAVNLYYSRLWHWHRIDEYPVAVRGMVFGGIVNQGPRVIGWVQECLSELCHPVEKDGVFGPQTKAALALVNVPTLLDKLWKKRALAYLVSARKPNQGKYLLGWLNRLDGGA